MGQRAGTGAQPQNLNQGLMRNENQRTNAFDTTQNNRPNPANQVGQFQTNQPHPVNKQATTDPYQMANFGYNE